MIEKGFYDEAVQVFSEMLAHQKTRMPKKDRESALITMAMAWRMSNRDLGKREEILSQLSGFADQQWLHSRVMFLIGEIDEKRILQLADTEKKRGVIYFYSGVFKYNEGKQDEALRSILISLETMDEREKGYRHAVKLAQKMAS